MKWLSTKVVIGKNNNGENIVVAVRWGGRFNVSFGENELVERIQKHYLEQKASKLKNKNVSHIGLTKKEKEKRKNNCNW